MMKKIGISLAALLLSLCCFVPETRAWGPHPEITRAAMDVQPCAAQWKDALGAENWNALAKYCVLPDQRGQDLGSFYADDYVIIPALPEYVSHVLPDAPKAYAPYFKQALQALRTETPLNACRQLGPLIHYAEDTGAPPHAYIRCPHHNEMETWVRGDQVAIPGYKPRLLGRTDEEALQGFQKRMEELAAFSAKRAERALPFVTAEKPDRSKVEPILLESALESARATADLIHTVLTLGLAPQPQGASLAGWVVAPALPGANDHGARVALLGSNYRTLAATTKGDGALAWEGAYRFDHLPAGTYRVLCSRTGARPVISAPITLQKGRTTTLNFTLMPLAPAGDLVENADASLVTLQKDIPDCWRVDKTGAHPVWSSAAAKVTPGAVYRCGAEVKDPTAQVRFRFQGRPGKKGVRARTVALPQGTGSIVEIFCTPGEQQQAVVVQIETDKPLADAVARVWVVPEASAPAPAK